MKLNHLLKFAILMLIISSCNTNSNEITYNWNKVVDRKWADKNFWTNRIQDWEVSNGKLVCKKTSKKNPMRTIHSVTPRLENDGDYTIVVSDPSSNLKKVFKGLIPQKEKGKEFLEITLN